MKNAKMQPHCCFYAWQDRWRVQQIFVSPLFRRELILFTPHAAAAALQFRMHILVNKSDE